MIRKYAKKLLERHSDNGYQTLNQVELSRANMLSNITYIKDRNPGHQVIPVLKANAYGHGLKQVAAIANGADCAFLAIDGYFEAAAIRDITRHRILVLGYVDPANVRLLDTDKCSFVVQDTAGLQAFGALGKKVRIHLELNTGMNRLGLSIDELPGYLQTLKAVPHLELEGVMTHLADADNDLDQTFNDQQIDCFDRMLGHIRTAGFNPRYIHVAQTAGSAKKRSPHANTIRLGVGLYGINPLSPADPYYDDLHGLKPVLQLKSTIIKVVDLKAGDRVSYNGIFTAPKPMKVGVLPIGYYEGVPRELSNKGVVTYGDVELPITGRICMNHTMVDLKDSGLTVGDEVTVISTDPSRTNYMQRIVGDYGLFPYLCVVRVASSVRRVVV